ncbi:TPA: hypothetical protein HA235_06090 [Candidatus Woesearchaeota archaeon]|nr:hypothetical protein [Candidatus Woesearchaeota archaeon]HIH32250.1 hypothetical protein [Candidatus Woesearchaeota archaeon]HIH54792.1 hypothetical protein [Candidatus Woesearchaeota archaeon]HIJ01362.1 hypothetical protein [Candidatus Woesearchaeota archaeon]HIJ14418.1 hypothetical protein [Candidatus Woesearchaeota archaeon]
MFNFLKKKPVQQQQFDINTLKTDLPSIEGLNLPDLDQSPYNSELPALDNQQPAPGLPALDFPTPNFPQSNIPNFPENAVIKKEVPIEEVSRDINQLFMPDPEWKEPDWNNFVPYNEPEIEPPTVNDFGVEEQKPKEPKIYELPEFTAESKTIEGPIPYDVFVKGSEYKKIFDEIDNIKQSLDVQDKRLGVVTEEMKKEDLLIKLAKESTETIYKRMLSIDKKVFV